MNQTRNLCLISPPPKGRKERILSLVGQFTNCVLFAGWVRGSDAFHSNAGTDAAAGSTWIPAKDNQERILVPIIARKMKIQPARSACVPPFETSVKIPSGSREIPLGLCDFHLLMKEEVGIFLYKMEGFFFSTGIFYWVSSERWVLPGGHHSICD